MPESGPRPDFATGLLQGLEHFNSLEFWEAHESWEELWLEATSEVHQFLQGMIQIAAAYHHIKRGTFSGAVRLFDAALRRVEPYPADYCGIDRAPLVDIARRHREWVAAILAALPNDPSAATRRLRDEEFPKIRMVDGWKQRIPKAADW